MVKRTILIYILNSRRGKQLAKTSLNPKYFTCILNNLILLHSYVNFCRLVQQRSVTYFYCFQQTKQSLRYGNMKCELTQEYENSMNEIRQEDGKEE